MRCVENANIRSDEVIRAQGEIHTMRAVIAQVSRAKKNGAVFLAAWVLVIVCNT